MAASRRTLLVLTAGAWVAAIGSASALAYALNRPLVLRPQTTLLDSPQEVEQTTGADFVTPVGTLSLPTTVIVGTARRVAQAPKPVEAAPVEVPAMPDIEKMHCERWRELDMGSGHVQVCE